MKNPVFKVLTTLAIVIITTACEVKSSVGDEFQKHISCGMTRGELNALAHEWSGRVEEVSMFVHVVVEPEGRCEVFLIYFDGDRVSRVDRDAIRHFWLGEASSEGYYNVLACDFPNDGSAKRRVGPAKRFAEP